MTPLSPGRAGLVSIRRPAVMLAAACLAVAACSSAGSAPTWTYPPAAAAPATGSAPAAPSALPTIKVTSAPAAAQAVALAFTPGTAAAPRIVKVTADDNLNFTPGLVQAAVGETVTFQIHNTGKAVHEFMVGPLDDVMADKEGTPEVADIGPGETGEITFTFTGTGPFAFACHAPGHFEYGMMGYIQLVGPGAPTVGTKDNPRVVWINMDDKLRFTPSTVQVTIGETVRFVLTNSGAAVHEFQVGVADGVAADSVDDVTVLEKDELDAGSTHILDYTFSDPVPYAFACHEPGHYEAGMKGTIQ